MIKEIYAESYEELCRIAAEEFTELLNEKPDAVLGLATGNTPLGLYAELARRHAAGELDFSKARSYNLDEYVGLAGDHPQSYRYYMTENLFSKVNFPENSNFLPSGVAEDVEAECAAYDEAMQADGGTDLQLLGLGRNGHVGFNEPGDEFIKATHRVELTQSTIEANSPLFGPGETMPTSAITMGIGGIMSAKKVLLIANGALKRDIFREALHGPITPKVPASILQLHPNVVAIFCD